MKFTIYLFLLFGIFINCSEKNNTCDKNQTPVRNYNGYGIIKFQKSYYGSIRYMEFYPICENAVENEKLFDISKANLQNGLIFRMTNNSKIWKGLVNDKSIELDENNYGLALIYLNYSENIRADKCVKNLDNILLIDSKEYKVKMFDTTNDRLLVGDFKILGNVR